MLDRSRPRPAVPARHRLHTDRGAKPGFKGSSEQRLLA
jgi:hypothetical protein